MANTRPAPAAGAGSMAPSTTPRSLRAPLRSPTITTIRINRRTARTGRSISSSSSATRSSIATPPRPTTLAIRPSSRGASSARRFSACRPSPSRPATRSARRAIRPLRFAPGRFRFRRRAWPARSIARRIPAGPTATRSGPARRPSVSRARAWRITSRCPPRSAASPAWRARRCAA